METPQLPIGTRELPVVAGDLALDFANTVDDPLGPQRHDHIADYRALLWWSVQVGVLAEDDADRLLLRSAPRRTPAVVHRAHQLREAINLAAGAVADQEAATATRARSAGTPHVGGGSLVGWVELRPFVSAAVEHADLSGSGADRGGPADLRPTWAYETLESPLWPVALAAYELLTGSRAARIKRCAGCPWLFLDQSKNGSRRWCSMEICGTNEKTRLYVARRAARRTRT